ncbi:MAG: tetratricopeptide repeat protein [Xanthomonadales bacterium]|nr:tetratricopeptide repeat protein [Xanthomonadales bacterium]
MADPSASYRFDNFEIDPAARQLLRDGVPVEVQGLVFDLLLFMAQRPGELLSKERLLDEVWRNQHLTDATIAQAVRKARAALGDDGRTQSIIRTVHGRGVRFEAEVEVVTVDAARAAIAANGSASTLPPVDSTQAAVGRHASPDAASAEAVAAAPASTPLWRRPALWLAAAALGVAALAWHQGTETGSPPAASASHAPAESPRLQRVAVFAFENATGDADLDWFERGLATATRDLLDPSQGIQAIGPGDLAEVPDGDLAQRSAFAGAAFGLDASIAREGGRFVVDWTLARARGEPLRGQFHAADTSLIARELARLASDAAGGRPPLQPAPELDLGDPLAIELYSRGMEAFMHDDREQAMALLSAARSRAPASIPLQIAATVAGFDPADVPASLQRYREHIATLPTDATGARSQLQFQIGDLLWYAGEVQQAQGLLEAALVDVGADAALHARILNSLSFVEQSLLRYDDAWTHARAAEALLRDLDDPYRLSMALTNLGYLAEDMGRLAEAGGYHEEAMRIREAHGFPSLIAASRYGLGRILRRSGRFDEAAAQLEAALQTVEELELLHDVFDNLEELAEVRMRQRAFDEADALLVRARAVAAGHDDALGMIWERQVRTRLQLRRGQVDAATRAAHEAVIRDFESLGERQDALRARIELAQVLLALGDAKPAADALVSATQVEGFSANPVLQIEHAVCFAQLQVAQGRQQDALSALLEAVARAKQIGVLDIEAEAAISAGQLALSRRDLATAGRMLAVARAWSPGYYRTTALAEAMQVEPVAASLP